MRLGGKTVIRTLRGLPIVGSAASLMAANIATSLLGLPFWMLAAQLYSGSSLGVSSIGVNLTVILAEVACLGMRDGVIRYVPRAEGAAPKTVLFSYVIGSSVAAVALAVFLVGLPLWGANLGVMRSSFGLAVYVVLAGACWALFMLQDSVLVALGKSAWVPIENTIFGLAKLALLFPFASWSPEFGIYWSWTLPVLPIVLVINWLIVGEFRRSSDSRRYDSVEAIASPRLAGSLDRDLLRKMMLFSLAVWRSSLARLFGIVVISLLILDRLGQVASGYFQIAWTMAYALFSVSAAAAFALLVDRRGDRQSLGRNSLQVGSLCLAVTALASLVGVVTAPMLLRLFGSDFPANASTLMRLLFLAALPNVVLQMYLGYLRTRDRLRTMVVVETGVSALAVVLTAILIDDLGINGVGWAWLVSVSAVSVYAALSESVWWWASWIGTGVVRRVGGWVRWVGRAVPASGRKSLNSRLRAVAGLGPARVRWLAPGSPVASAVFATSEASSELVFRFATSIDGADALADEVRTVRDLRALELTVDVADMDRIELNDLLPDLVREGRASNAEFVVWRRPAGHTGADLVGQGWSPIAVAEAVMPIVGCLHAATAECVVIDDEVLGRWIEPALARLGNVDTVTEDSLANVRAVLHHDVVGCQLELGTVHGGLIADNVVLGLDPATVVGLRGWRSVDGPRPLFLDQAVLALGQMAGQQQVELGQLVRQLLFDPSPLSAYPGLSLGPAAVVASRSVLLLAWLHLVEVPHHERSALVPEFLWMARNVRPVLDAVADLRAAERVSDEDNDGLNNPEHGEGPNQLGDQRSGADALKESAAVRRHESLSAEVRP